MLAWYIQRLEYRTIYHISTHVYISTHTCDVNIEGGLFGDRKMTTAGVSGTEIGDAGLMWLFYNKYTLTTF